MKIAKRVLLCILALALLISGVVVASFADDTATEPEGEQPIAPVLPDYADVLKYYDPVYSTLYSNEDFEDGAYDGSIVVMDSAADETRFGVSGSSDKYLSIKLGHLLNPYSRTDAMYKVGFGAISKVLISAKVSGSYTPVSAKVCNTCAFTTLDTNRALCPNCSLELSGVNSAAPTVSFTVSDNTGIGEALVKLDFASGKILFFNGSGYDAYEDYTVYADREYLVEIVCDGTKYGFSVTGPTDDNDATEVTHSISNIPAPIFTFISANVGALYSDNVRNAEIRIDDVFVQAGIDNRTVGVDLVKATADGLALIDTMLRSADYSAEVKLDVVGTYDILTSTYLAALNSVMATDGEQLIKAKMEAVADAIARFFSSELKIATDAIDVTASYPVRLALIDGNAVYAQRVTAILSGVDIEAASEVLKNAEQTLIKYNVEKDALAALASESERFIAFMAEETLDNPDTFSTDDYTTMYNFLVKARAEFEVDGVKTYSTTYPAIKEANGTYNVLETKFNTYLSKSEIFCESVAIAAKASGADGDLLTDEEYSKSLEAYEEAKEIGFSNASFPGMAEALEIFASLTDLNDISVVAKRFIDNVATAEQAIYLFMKEETLDTAEADIEDVDSRYPGVSDAIVLYNKLRQEIADKKLAADNYIAAVNAIEGKTGDELIAAIEAALALKEAGDVIGYDGVTEANIILNHAYSSEQLRSAYASKYVRLVDDIKNAKTLEERYNAITLAEQTRGFADDSYDGVTEASEALVIAMSRYNADVAAVNSSFGDVAENAGILSVASTVLSKIMKLVVSTIKFITG